jgi:hypothetical protein
LMPVKLGSFSSCTENFCCVRITIRRAVKGPRLNVLDT